MSMEQEVKNIFKYARKIYKQTGEEAQFYTSTRVVKGLFFTVLPDPISYKFSSYDPGNKKDVNKVLRLTEKNIFKSYLCTLCPLGHHDTAVTCSQEQNQLWDNNKAPSKLINKDYTGISGRKYKVTGTVPQYFYSHLMFMSEDHIPTYGIFSDVNLFVDTMSFLKDSKVIGYHNGNFGSDIYHFHLHITDQKNAILDSYFNNFIQDMKGINNFFVNREIVKSCVMIDDNITDLFNNVSRIMFRVIDKQNKDLVISSSLFVREHRGLTYYCVVLNFINRNYRNFEYEKCNFFVFPASYTLSVGCMTIPTNKLENKNFLESLENHYSNYYIDPKEVFDNYFPDYTYIQSMIGTDEEIIQRLQFAEDTLHSNIGNFFTKNTIEIIYVLLFIREQNFNILEPLVALNVINTYYPDLRSLDIDTLAKVKYFMSLCINSFTKEEIHIYFNSDEFINMRLLTSNIILSNYGNLKSDYLFFKGKFLQKLISSNIKNRIDITSGIEGEKDSVNKWLKYDFKQIGEASASGTVTVAKLQDMDIDFIMKLMITDNPKYPDKLSEFRHELNTSLIVNELRYLVPNYILCYGGYQCKSSSFEKLCDGSGNKTSYLLLEYVKNSNTLGRHIMTPKLIKPDEENSIIDMISQVLMGLYIGFKERNFTHYDLHIDNIMAYDFINNPGYLKLFKGHKEYNDPVPDIENVIFRYYINRSNDNYLQLPVEYLYLIIDYGNSYVSGMDPKNVRKGLFGSDKPNKSSDCYTFLFSVFLNLFIYKPFLLIKNTEWLDNNLTRMFYKFLDSYKELWITDVKEIMKQILMIIVSKSAHKYGDIITYFSQIKNKKYGYRDPRWQQYLPQNFDTKNISEDFSGALEIVLWMSENIYNKRNLKQISNSETTYIFNWGYVPEGEKDGIIPTEEIKQKVKNKEKLKIEKIKNVKAYIQNVLTPS